VTQAITATVTSSMAGLTQQRPGQKEAQERLQQLQLANRCNAALCQTPIPEHEADQHAEHRHIGQAQPCRQRNVR